MVKVCNLTNANMRA